MVRLHAWIGLSIWWGLAVCMVIGRMLACICLLWTYSDQPRTRLVFVLVLVYGGHTGAVRSDFGKTRWLRSGFKSMRTRKNRNGGWESVSNWTTRSSGLHINRWVHGDCKTGGNWLSVTSAWDGTVDGGQQAALRWVGNVVCNGVEVDGFLSDMAVHRRCTVGSASSGCSKWAAKGDDSSSHCRTSLKNIMPLCHSRFVWSSDLVLHSWVIASTLLL